MKRILFYILIVATYFSSVEAIVDNTKHNLSATSGNYIRASGEQEVCVFCHIVHDAQPGKPLWNRAMPVSAYVMYDSEYLKRSGYTTPTDLGSVAGTPGSVSRQCLSCHDGTVAIGAVYMVRGNLLGNTYLDVIGTSTTGTMTTATPGFIGTDLSIHHPVGIEYDPTNSKNFDVGSKSIELKTVPDAPLKLYNYAGKNYIECSSCHNPHLENKKFLRVISPNHGQNVKNTCIACHDKTPGDSGVLAHRDTVKQYTSVEVMQRYNNGGAVSTTDLYCVNCHTPHNGLGKPYLLRHVEQNTCYMGASGTRSTAPCHGTGSTLDSTKQIEPILNRPFAHPTNTTDGKHTNLDSLYGVGSTDPAGAETIQWSTSKHAECMDCHNQHRVGKGTHTPANQWYPDTPTNLVSGVLRKVQGVQPIWPTAWTQPTSFQTLAESEKEHQICFKCHSYWALGPTVSTDMMEIETAWTNNVIDNEGQFMRATDVAFEYNPNNRSAHPVVEALNNRPGSYAPKALQASAMRHPWNQNVGTQTMYCSDCHGADNEHAGDPKGPHGSSFNFMLKGPNKYWPTKPDGTLFTYSDIQPDGSAPDLFCANCHNLAVPHRDWQVSMWNLVNVLQGNTDIPCVSCHVAVPHGSPVSRLIGYTNFPEPYNFVYQGEKQLLLKGYKKNAVPGTYNMGNAYVDTVKANSLNYSCACHSNPSPAVTYDLVTPMP